MMLPKIATESPTVQAPAPVPSRVVAVNAGELLPAEVVNALRFPERLISSRHLRRDHSGRLVARRAFAVAIPAATS
jgi:hypothetical protein